MSVRSTGLTTSAAAILVFAIMLAQPATAQTTGSINKGPSGLPLPRFVSLKANRINVRSGPSRDQDVRWVYTRAGMPVEVTAEFENWRRIRDWQGTEGWVHQSMVQGQRGILVTGKRHTLRRRPLADSPGVALVDAGAVGVLEHCETDWCEVSLGGFTGWLEREAFYGLYPGEEVD